MTTDSDGKQNMVISIITRPKDHDFHLESCYDLFHTHTHSYIHQNRCNEVVYSDPNINFNTNQSSSSRSIFFKPHKL